LAPLVLRHLSDTIKEINGSTGLTIFIVEQNVLMTLEMAEYGYILENGRVVGSGEAEVLLQDERVKGAYLGISNIKL
jgi:branched-chain amino acid transport system ATP-binding protein